ncbi:unnamed protein product [Closterium sp. NIES-54]
MTCHAQPAASCSKSPHAALRPLLPPVCSLPSACLLPPACLLPAACLPACLLPACCLPACCHLPATCLLPTCCLPATCCLLSPACLLPAAACLPPACVPDCCLLPPACSLPPACLLLAAPASCLCLLPPTWYLLPLPAACYLLPEANTATPNVLAFEPDGRPIEFSVWLDDLQLFLLTDAKDGVSLFDYVSGSAVAPAADAPALERSQWQTRDAAARLAIRNHLPITERAHFSQHRTAQTLYDAVVARYSSPATAAIGRLMLPYLFPDLSSLTTAEDLVSHLRATYSRFRAALSAEFCAANPTPMYFTLYFLITRLPDTLSSVRDHFLALDPTTLTVLLEETRATSGAGAAEGTGTTGGARAVGGAGAAGGAGATGAGGTAQQRLFFAPPSPSSQPPPDSALREVLSLPSSTGLPLQPGSPLPAPSPYTEQTSGLAERREPASRPVSPVRSGRSGRRVPSHQQPAVSGSHLVVRRPSSPALRVPLPSPPASSVPVDADPASDQFRAEHSTVTRLLATFVTDLSFESAAASALVADLVDFAVACRLDYAASLVAESESVCPPSVGAEAIAGEYSSQWQTAMDAEMASWKSTGTYVKKVPPPGANIVSGMWIFRVKRPPGSPPVFKARYVARGFSQREGVDFFHTFSPTPKMTTLRVLLHVAAQRDYELHSLDFSTAFLQGSLHEEIWLRRPPGFTGSFPPGNQWSLRRPVYSLCQAPHPSLFLRTDTSLPPFYVLVYVDDLVFATADTEALALVKSELQKRHMCTDLGELRSYLGLQITRDRPRRTITLTQSHMVQQVLKRFGFTWSLAQSTPLAIGHSLSAPPSDESVEPSGPYPELVGCLICEAEIYATAMAAQELRWLTYLLTDLGERPCSPPVLYVFNKAAIALCQEHRVEHRTKHIALRYFLARELQLRGQLRLTYVATRANTADIFTKALPPGDHQRSCTLLGLVPTLPHLL